MSDPPQFPIIMCRIFGNTIPCSDTPRCRSRRIENGWLLVLNQPQPNNPFQDFNLQVWAPRASLWAGHSDVVVYDPHASAGKRELELFIGGSPRKTIKQCNKNSNWNHILKRTLFFVGLVFSDKSAGWHRYFFIPLAKLGSQT